MKTYSKWQCPYCKKVTSLNGLARVSHLRKHVRQGLLVEFTPKWSKQIQFTPKKKQKQQ